MYICLELDDEGAVLLDFDAKHLVEGLLLRVSGLGFGVWGFGIWVWGLGFGIL